MCSLGANTKKGGHPMEIEDVGLEIVEIEGKWVVAFKDKHDENNQRSIISVENSRELALEDALRHVLNMDMKKREDMIAVVEILKSDFDYPVTSRSIEVDGLNHTING